MTSVVAPITPVAPLQVGTIKPLDAKDVPNIQDATANNLSNDIKTTDYLEIAKQLRNEQWEREDAIRRETQAREDNAIYRKIADMRRSGVNPNLAYSMTGAESGGGITNATGTDTSLKEKDMEIAWQKIEQAIQNDFEGDQNEKDRIKDFLKTMIYSKTMLGSALIKGLM